jgi:hypothetical protein
VQLQLESTTTSTFSEPQDILPLSNTQLLTRASAEHTFHLRMSSHPQDSVQTESLRSPETFWANQASRLHWHKPPTQILTETTKKLQSGNSHKHWEWFADGEISTCYNCVDRHVLAGNGDETAIIWDSPVTGTKTKTTYKELLKEVETFAGVLRDEGVKKGDVLLIYSKGSYLLIGYVGGESTG